MEEALSISVVFFIFLALGIIISLRQRIEDRKLLFKLFIQGFLLRVGIVIFIYVLLNSLGHEGGFYPQRYAPFYRDDLSYHNTSQWIAESWHNRAEPFFSSTSNPGYQYIIAVVYFLFGNLTLAARIVNCFFGALTIIYVYLLAKEIWGAKIARISAYLTLFFPELIAWGSFQYKDTLMTFLVVFSIWSITALKRKITIQRMALLTAAIFCSFTIRKQTGIFLGLTSIIYVLIDLKRLRPKHIIAAFLIFIISGIGFSQLNQYGFFGKDYFSEIGERLDFYQEKAASEDDDGGLRQGIINRFAQANFVGKTILFPVVALVFMVTPIPLPGFILYFGHVFFVPGMWYWYFLFPCFFYGLFYSYKNKLLESSHILMTILYVTLSFVITSMTASGTSRYRLQMMPFAMILAAIGVANFKKMYLFYLMASFFTIVAMISYMLIKSR